MSQANVLRLGQNVTDATTGMKGMLSGFVEYLHGSKHCIIQPPAVDNRLPDCISVDYYLVDVVDDGIADRVQINNEEVTIKLGEEVRDKVTGWKGIASNKHHSLHGCIEFGVVSQMIDDEKGEPKTVFINHKRLEKIGDGVSLTNQSNDTGGPTRSDSPLRAARF